MLYNAAIGRTTESAQLVGELGDDQRVGVDGIRMKVEVEVADRFY